MVAGTGGFDSRALHQPEWQREISPFPSRKAQQKRGHGKVRQCRAKTGQTRFGCLVDTSLSRHIQGRALTISPRHGEPECYLWRGMERPIKGHRKRQCLAGSSGVCPDRSCNQGGMSCAEYRVQVAAGSARKRLVPSWVISDSAHSAAIVQR